jgi:hypothetical protein
MYVENVFPIKLLESNEFSIHFRKKQLLHANKDTF